MFGKKWIILANMAELIDKTYLEAREMLAVSFAKFRKNVPRYWRFGIGIGAHFEIEKCQFVIGKWEKRNRCANPTTHATNKEGVRNVFVQVQYRFKINTCWVKTRIRPFLKSFRQFWKKRSKCQGEKGNFLYKFQVKKWSFFHELNWLN